MHQLLLQGREGAFGRSVVPAVAAAAHAASDSVSYQRALILLAGVLHASIRVRQSARPPQFAVWGLPGADIVFTGNQVNGWRHVLFAEKAGVTACDNRVTKYGTVGIKLTQRIGSLMVIGNVFERVRDRDGFAITGSEGIIRDKRAEI